MRPIVLACIAVIWTSTETPVNGAEPPPIDSVENVIIRQFEVYATVENAGSPIESLQMWYTEDRGQTWHHHGAISHPGAPQVFTANQEGLYGFYFVAVNAAGRSGPDPGPETEPHHWVFVDYSPPVVELRDVRFDGAAAGPRLVPIRWFALDAALAKRPVLIEYRTLPDGAWRPVDDALANTESYDWRVPDVVVGRVALRITVRDEAGHRTEVCSAPFDLPRATLPHQEVSSPAASRARESAAQSSEQRRQVPRQDRTDSARERAVELYRKGVLHAMRGEYRLASSRLQDALSLDAEFNEALVELGRVLYAQKRIPEAIEAYELALRQQPESRSALEGLALAYIGQRRFSEAVRQLGRIVRRNPRDVETWLNLGDVAIYQGDELLAGEHYTRAATLDPTATEVVEKARLRLAELERLASEFTQVDAVR